MLTGRLIVGEVEPEHVGGALYPSFLCGALFSALSGIATGRVRLDDLSVSRAAAWGAVSGVLVGALPFVLGDQHNPGERPLWVLPVAVISASGWCSPHSQPPFRCRSPGNSVGT